MLKPYEIDDDLFYPIRKHNENLGRIVTQMNEGTEMLRRTAFIRLLPLHAHFSHGIFLSLFVAACVTSYLLPAPFAVVEQFGVRLARRKTLCCFLLAGFTIVLRLSLLWTIRAPFPAVHDEFAYLLAGDTFAHGRLTNPTHPMWIYFDTFHVNQHPVYTSIFPPAQGAALAVGQLLGHPWIGVLLSAAVMTGAVLWALQGWLPPRWALLGGILVLFRLDISSYWMNSYFGGAVAATGGALVFGAFRRLMRRRRTRDALLLGLGAGILANSRPFEGLIFCIPVIAALVVWLCGRHGPSRGVALRRIVLPLGAVMLLCLCFIGYYNRRLTGHATVFPHDLNIRTHLAIPQLAWQRNVAPIHFQNPQFEDFYNRWWPGIAWQKGRPDRITHIVGAFRVYTSIFVYFFLSPDLLVAAIALPWVLRDRRMRFPVAQMIVCLVGFVLVATFEAHYAAPLLATTFAVLVQGLRHIRRWRIRNYVPGIHLVRATVIVSLWWSPHHGPLVPSMSMQYRQMEYRQRIVAQLAGLPGSDLVIVRYSGHHYVHCEWVYNDVDIDHAKIVWAREIPGVPLQPLLDYFHDRRVWIVAPDDDPPKLSPYVPPSGTGSQAYQAGHPSVIASQNRFSD